MNDLLYELSADIHEYIDCIMDDVIILTPDIKLMLLTINKIHTLKSKMKYMGLLLSSKDNLPTNTLGIMCESYINSSYTYNSQGYKFIYWLCYLFSTISNKAFTAYQTNQ